MRARASQGPARQGRPLVGPKSQRGIAVLAAILVLLVTMTLMIGYLHRTLLFGSRSAANQWRATRAFHAAEAGFDWALARLNDTTAIGDDCQPSPGGSSFRHRYLQPSPSGNLQPAEMVGSPGPVSCALGAGMLRCTCPMAVATAPAASGPKPDNLNDDVRFAIALTPVAGDARAVVLTAHGCTDVTSACTSGDDEELLQAFARVQAIVKLSAAAAASQPSPPLAVVPGSWHDE